MNVFNKTLFTKAVGLPGLTCRLYFDDFVPEDNKMETTRKFPGKCSLWGLTFKCRAKSSWLWESAFQTEKQQTQDKEGKESKV